MTSEREGARCGSGALACVSKTSDQSGRVLTCALLVAPCRALIAMGGMQI